MAARKGKTAHSPSAAEFTIILKDLRSQFKVFGEALEAFRQEWNGAIAALREEMVQSIASLREEVRSGSREVDVRFGTLERDVGLVKTAALGGVGFEGLECADEEEATASPDPHAIREIFGRFVPEYPPMSAGGASVAPVARAITSRPTPLPPIVPRVVATES
jgi:hypothetical protein